MPGFEIFGEEEKKEILDVLDTGVLFRYEFAEQRKLYRNQYLRLLYQSICKQYHSKNLFVYVQL